MCGTVVHAAVSLSACTAVPLSSDTLQAANSCKLCQITEVVGLYGGTLAILWYGYIASKDGQRDCRIIEGWQVTEV